jgi:hypothetical protein
MPARRTDVRLNTRFVDMLDAVRPCALSQERWDEWLNKIAKSHLSFGLNFSTAKRWLSHKTARLHEFTKFFAQFQGAFPEVISRLGIRNVQDLIERPLCVLNDIPHSDGEAETLRLLDLQHAQTTEQVRSILAGQDRTYNVTSEARCWLQDPIVANRVLKLAEPLVLERGNEASDVTGIVAILMATVDSYSPARRQLALQKKVCERHLTRLRSWKTPCDGRLCSALAHNYR